MQCMSPVIFSSKVLSVFVLESVVGKYGKYFGKNKSCMLEALYSEYSYTLNYDFSRTL